MRFIISIIKFKDKKIIFYNSFLKFKNKTNNKNIYIYKKIFINKLFINLYFYLI